MPFSDEPIRPKSRESSGLPSSDPTQLSSPERVKRGVGTIALNPEGYRGVAGTVSGSNGRPSHVATGAASRPLSERSDADGTQPAGTGNHSAAGYLVERFRRPSISCRYRMTH